MRYALLAFLPAALASPLKPRQSYFSFGNYFSTGRTAQGSFIIDASTTLVLPALQSPHDGNLGLWPGMGMDDGDLVQGLAISVVGQGSPCNMAASEVKWCVLASTFDPTGQHHGTTPYRANPGDRVTYRYVTANGVTTQYVSVNGAQVSTSTSQSGQGGIGWGTAMECQQVKCGTVPEHHWLNTTIKMNKADPNYSRTVGTLGASGSLTTSDGGLTWTAPDIKINQYTYV